MKNLILPYMFFSVVLITGVKTGYSDTAIEKFEVVNGNKIMATFDGAEVNYFFFTDSNNNALQFEDIDAPAKKNYNLIDGNYSGKIFDITYKESKVLNLESVAK